MKIKYLLSKILFLVILTIIISGITNVSALRLNKNIKNGYVYSEGGYYCVTGNEDTCSTFIQNEWAKAYPVGTPIKYDLGGSLGIHNFNVISDDNEYIEMLSQGNLGLKEISYRAMIKAIYYNFIDNQDILTYEKRIYSGLVLNYSSDGLYSLSDGYSITLEENQKGRPLTVSEVLGFCEKTGKCPKWLQTEESSSYYWLAGTVKKIDDPLRDNLIEKPYPNSPCMKGTEIKYCSAYPEVGNPEEINVRSVIKIKKFENGETNADDTTTSEGTSSNNSTINNGTNSGNSTTTDKKGSQTVDVKDTLKIAYLGYCIGTVILILGSMIIFQTYRKSKKEIKIVD